MNTFLLTKDTVVYAVRPLSPTVESALESFGGDFSKVFGAALRRTDAAVSADRTVIWLDFTDGPVDLHGGFEDCQLTLPGENLPGALTEARQVLRIGGPVMGVVRALYDLCRTALGVDPFAFWNGVAPARRESVSVAVGSYTTESARFRYRGWFVNGEDCLLGWEESYPPTEKVWRPVFETLLRCGGNLVCAGTDLPRDGVQHELAGRMGLILTHHHAEPLGADMFARRFPDVPAVYPGNESRFADLWNEAIARQKDHTVIWTLGFRGQGDRPFWVDDTRYDTAEKRAALTGEVICKQYELVRAAVPDAVFCTNIYGEITDLYRGGLLDLPADVIKVWADNGYGRMVSRRIGKDNPRTPSLPGEEYAGPHGVYYHVNYHDLLHSNQLTELQAPELIAGELGNCIQAGADEYLIVNSGHIRPHLYTLDFIANLWGDGSTNPDEHGVAYAVRNYPAAAEKAAQLQQQYFDTLPVLTEHADEKAGDEFYHHTARQIVTAWLRGATDKSSDYLALLAGADSFAEQILWHKQTTEATMEGWSQLQKQCDAVRTELPDEQQRRFGDSLRLQVTIHAFGCAGLLHLCRAFGAYHADDLLGAFLEASQARWAYAESAAVLAESEYGKWRHYYRGDWLTNISATVQACQALQAHLRTIGDGPTYCKWYQEHLIPPVERNVKLAYINRRTLSDDDLARALLEQIAL